MVNIETKYVKLKIHNELLLTRATTHPDNGELPEKLKEGKVYKFKMNGHHIYPLERISLYSTDIPLNAPESIQNTNKKRIGEVSILELTLTRTQGSSITSGEYIVNRLLKHPEEDI